MSLLTRIRGLLLASLLSSASALASVGTAGSNCTVADYQAANQCLNGTFGTIAGALGQCDLACNDMGTGQPPGSASGNIWCGAGQGVTGTVTAIGTVIQQQGNEILSCVTGQGVTHCVPVAVIVGGMICAAATAGACVPIMAAGSTALALGNCGYQCLGTNDPDACQQACAGSIITTTGSAIAAGTYYGPQLCLPVSQVNWLPRPTVPVPTPPSGSSTPPATPLPPPISGGAPGLTAEELAALMAGIKQEFPGNGLAAGCAGGEAAGMAGAPEAYEGLLTQKYPDLSLFEAMWQHMLATIAERDWGTPVNPNPPPPPH